MSKLSWLQSFSFGFFGVLAMVLLLSGCCPSVNPCYDPCARGFGYGGLEIGVTPMYGRGGGCCDPCGRVMPVETTRAAGSADFRYDNSGYLSDAAPSDGGKIYY